MNFLIINFYCLNLVKTLSSEVLAKEHKLCSIEDVKTIAWTSVLSVLSIVLVGLMAYGVRKRKRTCIVPWLVVVILEMVGIVYQFFQTIIAAIVLESAVLGWIGFVVGVTLFLLTLYSFLVVLQIYCNIKHGIEIAGYKRGSMTIPLEEL